MLKYIFNRVFLVINGEKAAVNNPVFAQKRERTLEMLIKNMHEEYITEVNKVGKHFQSNTMTLNNSRIQWFIFYCSWKLKSSTSKQRLLTIITRNQSSLRLTLVQNYNIFIALNLKTYNNHVETDFYHTWRSDITIYEQTDILNVSLILLQIYTIQHWFLYNFHTPYTFFWFQWSIVVRLTWFIKFP